MKKTLKLLMIGLILIVTLFTLVGCGDEDEKETKSSKNESKNVSSAKNDIDDDDDKDIDDDDDDDDDKKSNSTKDSKTNSTKDSKTNSTKDSKTTSKSIDKTAVDYTKDSAYIFVIDGVKYTAGDAMSSLSKSDLHLNKTGSEKELSANQYLIGGSAVLNSDNKTVINVSPVNNTSSKVTGAEASIGSFSIDTAGYEKLDGKVEITNGITIGTSLEDIEAVFGEPTSKTEATQYNGPTYTYSVKGKYKSFTFRFDTDNKVNSIRWENYSFGK